MSFKSKLLKRYVWDEQIYYIIHHDAWIYLWLIIKYALILAILFVSYKYSWAYLWEKFTSIAVYVNWVFWIVGFLFYILFVIRFFDYYLDSIILTDTWVILFKWDWLLKHTSESVQRNSIESVFDEQSWIFDILFKKWDLKVKRQWENYIFRDVNNPTAQADKILRTRDKMLEWTMEEEQLDKFDILVETLGEVILDYVKKSNK